MDKKLIKIKHLINYTKSALNNEQTVWNKDRIFSNCSYLKYLLVLYWIKNDSNYIQKCLTIYSINNTAKQLLLDFEKTRKAKNFYDDFVKRKEVSRTEEDTVCYEITKEGIKLCEDRLSTLYEIVMDLKNAYGEDDAGKLIKGIKSSKGFVSKSILRKIFGISRSIE